MSEEKVEGMRSFARFIQVVNYGEAHQELSDKLFELGQALRKQQIDGSKLKIAGSLTLVVKMTAEGDGPVLVSTDVSIKKPKTRRAASLYWLTKNGDLSDSDPRQLKLGLREVPRPETAEPREADQQPTDMREAP